MKVFKVRKVLQVESLSSRKSFKSKV